jgi:hypothetical protein
MLSATIILGRRKYLSNNPIESMYNADTFGDGRQDFSPGRSAIVMHDPGDGRLSRRGDAKGCAQRFIKFSLRLVLVREK